MNVVMLEKCCKFVNKRALNVYMFGKHMRNFNLMFGSKHMLLYILNSSSPAPSFRDTCDETLIFAVVIHQISNG